MITSGETNGPGDGLPNLSRQRLLGISLVSGLVYIALSWLLFVVFFDRSILTVFAGGRPLPTQMACGVSYGVIAALLIGGLFFRTPLKEILADYEIIRYIMQLRLRAADILQISFVAGTTEEILFRGAIQPLLGIWWTSVIFVGLHGYFRWDTPRHLLFGGVMFGLSVGLGYLSRDIGLPAAMAAHGVYDLAMLFAANHIGWLRS